MAALSAPYHPRRKDGELERYPVAANTKCYKDGMAALSGGDVQPAADAASIEFAGVFTDNGNYVNEPWPPDVGELSMQVELLAASLLYQKQWGENSSEIVRRIQPSLPDFYLPAIQSIHDYVNEKYPVRADSWVEIYNDPAGAPLKCEFR